MTAILTGAGIFAPETRTADELLHHQCWFFGRDILHESGNLLCRYGFERFGVPEGETGTNCYRLKQTDGREIFLWGFGILYKKATAGVFIKRYDFRPRIFTTGKLNFPVFKSGNLPCRLPRGAAKIDQAKRLTAEFIEWISQYEIWIEGVCGVRWREECLENWANASLSAAEIKSGWEKLRGDIL